MILLVSTLKEKQINLNPPIEEINSNLDLRRIKIRDSNMKKEKIKILKKDMKEKIRTINMNLSKTN